MKVKRTIQAVTSVVRLKIIQCFADKTFKGESNEDPGDSSFEIVFFEDDPATRSGAM